MVPCACAKCIFCLNWQCVLDFFFGVLYIYVLKVAFCLGRPRGQTRIKSMVYTYIVEVDVYLCVGWPLEVKNRVQFNQSNIVY